MVLRSHGVHLSPVATNCVEDYLLFSLIPCVRVNRFVCAVQLTLLNRHFLTNGNRIPFFHDNINIVINSGNAAYVHCSLRKRCNPVYILKVLNMGDTKQQFGQLFVYE